MPTYGYECTLCGAEFEVWQRITEDPLNRHEGCGGALRRRVYPAGIVFKGPGFHVNDYGPKRSGNGSATKPQSDKDSKDTTPAAAPETKTDAKPVEKATTP
ncbi:MAG: zinc ribbon domain-containing protein [Armatimonadetes bacterium]|nr:zinc ribbon domain-containing protein [Armatimonadota bacterium]